MYILAVQFSIELRILSPNDPKAVLTTPTPTIIKNIVKYLSCSVLGTYTP